MNPLTTIAALACVAFGGMAWACHDARRSAERDWREDWCCPECYAAHEQDGPCGDCPARRAAHRAAQCAKTTNYPHL